MTLNYEIDVSDLDDITPRDLIDMFNKLDYSDQKEFVSLFLEYNWITNLFYSLDDDIKEKSYKQIKEIMED